MATIYGGLVNAVLDPILIFGLDLELTGAALASVAARLTIAGTALVPLIRFYGGFSKPSTTSMAEDFKPILTIALPAILTQLATPVGAAFVTRAMASFGEDAVAGMAIVGRLTPIGFAIIFALSGAIGPIIGQNYGAGQMDRVRGAFRAGVIFTAVVVIVVSGLLLLFALDGTSLTLVFLFAGPLSLLYFFNGVIFVSNAAFNNLAHPFYSTWINWGRNTLGTVPFVMLGASIWGAPGVLVGQAFGGVAFAAIAWALARRVMEVAKPDNAVAEPFARQGRLHGLFSHRR